MGEIAVRCLCVGFTAWGMYFLLLDGTIANTVVKNIFSSTGEWICNLFRQSSSQNNDAKPFVVSEYLTRIEKASIEILESRKPIEQIVILWWGLDGLRLNEDGTVEWISRKKPSPVQRNVFYVQWPGYYAKLTDCCSNQTQDKF